MSMFWNSESPAVACGTRAAQQIGFDAQGKKQSQPIDPYYALMQLPGEQEKLEFLIFLPFLLRMKLARKTGDRPQFPE